MKKIFSIIILMLVFALPLIAESYEVLNFTGRVSVNNSEVAIGQVLNDEDILNVRPQSAITLKILNTDKFEKRTFKGPSNKIEVKEAWIKSAVGKGGLKMMKIADASHIAPPSDKPRQAVATAASRASEAKEDFEWDE